MTVGKLQATAAGKMLCLSSGKMMAECCCEGCELALGDDLQFCYWPLQSIAETQQITLANVGSEDVAWTSDVDGDSEVEDNVTLDPDMGDLSKGASRDIDVTLDGSGEGTLGDYAATLTVDGGIVGCTATALIALTIMNPYTNDIKGLYNGKWWGGTLTDYNATFTYLGKTGPTWTWRWTYQIGGTWMRWVLSIHDDGSAPQLSAVHNFGSGGSATWTLTDVSIQCSDGYPVVSHSGSWFGAGYTLEIGPDVW